MSTSRGLLLYTAKPILQNGDLGPAAGAMIMGRFLGEAEIGRLRDQTRVNFSVREATSRAGSPDRRQDEGAGASIDVQPVDQSTLTAEGPMPNSDGTVSLLVKAETPRQITLIGARTVNTAMLGFAGAGAVLLIVLGLL